MIKTNYHCHTTFCDGNNTVEEMVKAAKEKGFNILGISSHSMNPFAASWHIAPREHETYCKEVRRVKELYKDSIEVYCGFETDYVQGVCTPSFENYKEYQPDFLIGSVHYVTGDKGYFEADGKPLDVLTGIRNAFNGNEKKAVQAYFDQEREMLRNGDFTFLVFSSTTFLAS